MGIKNIGRQYPLVTFSDAIGYAELPTATEVEIASFDANTFFDVIHVIVATASNAATSAALALELQDMDGTTLQTITGLTALDLKAAGETRVLPSGNNESGPYTVPCKLVATATIVGAQTAGSYYIKTDSIVQHRENEVSG